MPNPDAQIALMHQVYEQAGIDPDEIDYLEAHGTGTAVGDPIETRAIGEALAKRRKTPLPIGSVKSNLGHLETASGVAGLAKALYSLRHREVPATIGIRRPNPRIAFDDWNLEVVTQARALKPEGRLVIGVNSFASAAPTPMSSSRVRPRHRRRSRPPSPVSRCRCDSRRGASRPCGPWPANWPTGCAIPTAPSTTSPIPSIAVASIMPTAPCCSPPTSRTPPSAWRPSPIPSGTWASGR